jgi:hypothetical protein
VVPVSEPPSSVVEPVVVSPVVVSAVVVPESSVVGAAVVVVAVAAVVWVAVVCGADDDEGLPPSSPLWRMTKTISRTPSAPRTMPARCTPDSPRPESSPPPGGISGDVMSAHRVRPARAGSPRISYRR